MITYGEATNSKWWGGNNLRFRSTFPKRPCSNSLVTLSYTAGRRTSSPLLGRNEMKFGTLAISALLGTTLAAPTFASAQWQDRDRDHDRDRDRKEWKNQGHEQHEQ